MIRESVARARGLERSCPGRRALLRGKCCTLLALAFLIPGCKQGEPTPPARPNILLIVADQFRADVIGPYGGRDVPTPNLDRLAAEGITFDNAVSVYPLCTPYRGMLMTGRLPTHSGIVINGVHADHRQNPDTLGRVFAEAGYDTAYIGKWHLSAGARRSEKGRLDHEMAKARDPNSEFVPPGPGRLGFEHWEAYNLHTDFNHYWFYRDEPRKLFEKGFETDVQTDQAIAFMESRRDRREPFLLILSPHPPHPPWIPDHLPQGYLHGVPWEIDWRPNVPADSPVRKYPVQFRYYLAMVKNLDANVGRILAYLDAAGLADETLVIVTSDHGEMFGSQGRSSKMLPYTESLSVPLIARLPGMIPAGIRTDALQSPVDYLPTLAGMAGIPVPDEVEGLDLGQVLEGGPGPPRDELLIMNLVSHWYFFETQTDWSEWRGVFTRTHTYVKWIDGREELYDRVRDPYQMHDLASRPGSEALLVDFRDRLQRLLAEAHDEFPPGTAYADWYDDDRRLVRTALGPVP